MVQEYMQTEFGVKTYYVCSYGGSGSKMLRDFLQHFGNTWHVHTPRPPKKLTKPVWGAYEFTFTGSTEEVDPSQCEVIYIYRNPVKAIICRYGLSHVANCEGDLVNAPDNLEEYVRLGRDYMRLNKHFRNWACSDRSERNYDIILVKYENLWHNLEALFKLLKLPNNLVNSFPRRRETQRPESEKFSNQLLVMYRELVEKIEQMEPIKVV